MNVKNCPHCGARLEHVGKKEQQKTKAMVLVTPSHYTCPGCERVFSESLKPFPKIGSD